MAVPITFEQANRTLGPPKGWTEEQCQDLPVQLVVSAEMGPAFISCWQLTPEEIQTLQDNGGKMYLWIMGSGHPVVYVSPQYADAMRDILGKVAVINNEDKEEDKEDGN